jgi:preprotein translocase subunit SecE
MAQDGKNKKQFFREFKAELKKVIWPTPKQIVTGTIAVITIVLITAVIVFGLDSVFNAVNQYGIHNIKQRIENRNAETQDTENDINEELEPPEIEIPEEPIITEDEENKVENGDTE